MLDLETILRTRFAHQIGAGQDSRRNFTLIDGLNRSIWIYDDFGLVTRLKSSIRSPVKRLPTQERVKLPLGRAYRIFHRRMAAMLYPGFQTPVQDKDLVESIPEGGITRRELAEKLEMTIRKLNYRIRKEQNNWQVVKHDDRIYLADDFFATYDDSSDPKHRILNVLQRYPYCSVDQLELFTNLDRTALSGPITNLAATDNIVRGLTRIEAPDEIFALPTQQLVDDQVELPVAILEKRDALVEMIKLERYFESEDSDYWIFIDGIPQAEFDLEKQDTKQRYNVKNLHRFLTTNYELSDILEEIQRWGKTQSLYIETDTVDDPSTTYFQRIVQLLVDRGYQNTEEGLILDRNSYKKPVQGSPDDRLQEERSKPDILNWKILGPWCRNRQFLQYDGTPAELLYHLGQVDDARSIAYRLQVNPDRLDFEDIVYIPGINFRMGFVHKAFVEDIIRGWPKQVKFNFLDKKILAQLETPHTTVEIMDRIGESPTTVKQRLRYLEKSRVIRKVLPGSLHMDHCTWVKFDDGLEKYKKPVGGKRAMASVGTFLIMVLENNPPLTKNQLSRFLGLTKSKLEPLLKQYLRTNKIIEGYFVENISDIQYTIPEVLDTITVREAEPDDLSAANRVDILPLSDPFALLHLPPLVMEDPSIQPTQRLDETAEQWMIMWDGIPVGYMIKQPTMEPLVDYKLDLKITQSMITTPIIAGALQKIVGLFRTWFGDEGKISTINNTAASASEWKDIHFMIESIGIKMD